MSTADKFFAPNAAGDDIDAVYCLAILERIAYTGDVAHLQRWASAFGYPVARFVQTPDRVTPNLCIVGTPQKLIVAIPGTESFQQMVNNIIYCALERNIDYGLGEMHSFFLYCAKSIISFVQSSLPDYPDLTEIVFVGHSLGGAVAQLLADWVQLNTPVRVKLCVTFNSPRVGDSVWARRLRAYPTHLYYCTHDMVCEIPPNDINDQHYDWFGNPYSQQWEHRPGQFPIPSLANIDASWMAVGVSKVVYPVKWATGIVAGAERAATFMKALGVIGSRAALASWVLPLPAWYYEHLMDSVIPNIEAMPGFTGFPERNAISTANLLIPRNPNPPAPPTRISPWYVVPVSNFAPGVSAPVLPVSAMPPDPVGFRAEIIESSFEWLGAVPIGTPSGLISVDDSFIAALTTAAAAAGESPLLSSSPVVADVPSRPHWLYRGTDRNMLEKLWELIQAIDNRDRLAEEGNPTAAISTRDHIIPPSDEETFNAWQSVKEIVSMKLYTRIE